MSTPAQFRIESKYRFEDFDTGEVKELFLKQDMYTYSDGYSYNYIPDAIMAIPNWFFGIVKAYGLHENGSGTHWFLSFAIRKWIDEETENQQETMKNINENFKHLYFIDEFDIHLFIRMWIQYGSAYHWIPFSDENLGGEKEWAYYEKDAEPNFVINIFSKNTPDNQYNKIGYEVFFPVDNYSKKLIKKSIANFKKVTDIKLELREENKKFIIFIPFVETLKNLTFKNQNMIREKLILVKKRVRKNEDD